MPASTSRLPAILVRALALPLVMLAASGCVRDPLMRFNHAEISGARIGLPPSVVLTVVVDVTNPNAYDVAVRAVKGTVVLANKYSVPIDFRAADPGLWIASDRVGQVRVPVSIPIQLALGLLQEWYFSPAIPYRFAGRADVTATRTFQIEKDDYSIDVNGSIPRWQMEAAMRGQ